MTLERLRTTLAALSLTAIDARLEALLESASKKEPAYADFLLEVISAEAEARRQRYLKTRLQLAHLPYLKTFDQFDFTFQPSIDERQIRELRTLRFVHEASNVILLGPPGVGNTHLTVAFAAKATGSKNAARPDCCPRPSRSRASPLRPRALAVSTRLRCEFFRHGKSIVRCWFLRCGAKPFPTQPPRSSSG